MYAVIRSGGKQYRVAPGDVIRVESVGGQDGKVSFGEVLAISGGEGQIAKPGADVQVSGEILEQGRADKILVFHYKRKKQYKKIAGHRQPFTAVRITEIAFDGQSFKAPELPKKEVKERKVRAHETAEKEKKVKPAAVAAEKEVTARAAHAPAKKKAAAKKQAGKKPAPKKKK